MFKTVRIHRGDSAGSDHVPKCHKLSHARCRMADSSGATFVRVASVYAQQFESFSQLRRCRCAAACEDAAPYVRLALVRGAGFYFDGGRCFFHCCTPSARRRLPTLQAEIFRPIFSGFGINPALTWRHTVAGLHPRSPHTTGRRTCALSGNLSKCSRAAGRSPVVAVLTRICILSFP